MKDVARRARVSIATVSKVVNGSGYVSPGVRARVEAAIAELGYRPNAVAQSLRSSRTRTVGVVIPDIGNPFWTVMARGLEKVLAQYGYTLLMVSTDEEPDKERQYLELLYARRVDGMVVATTGGTESTLAAIAEQLPMVLVDRSVTGVPADIVVEDNVGGAAALVRHLARVGHRRIGIIDGNLGLATGQARHDGFVQGLREAGLPAGPEVFYPGGFTFAGGQAGAAHFLDQPPERRPTALVAANNLMAAGALRCLKERGVEVPEEMALVSFGEVDYYGQLIDPPLTVARQQPEVMGARAGELLLTRLRGKARTAAERRYEVLPIELVVRESCGIRRPSVR